MTYYGRILIKVKYKKRIFLTQIFLGIGVLLLWEILANFKIIDKFITSSPTLIVKTIYQLIISENLFHHIWITFFETIVAFTITMLISLIVSIILYESNFLARVIDPYLTMFNSLPKVALGPILIIWLGANMKTIIVMGILITLIVSIETIYNGFKNTPANKIKLMKTFDANRKDIFLKLVFPSNIRNIVVTMKINIALCLIGIVMGEFLTSKAGIGYLIMYGSQVFNLNLVMSGIILLLILSILMYNVIRFIEKRLENY